MLLAYGQTGSGKTYTVTGIERLLVDTLIQGQSSGKKEVRVCIFEVAGSNMFGEQFSPTIIKFCLTTSRSSKR